MSSTDVFAMPHQYSYHGQYLNRDFQPSEHIDAVREVKLTGADVLLTSFPRTGSTLAGNITSLILSDDVEETANKHLGGRIHYLERLPSQGVQHTVEDFNALQGPRILRTHLWYKSTTSWVEDCEAKVVLATRNPKDTLVSLYHFYKGHEKLGNFPGTWSDFFSMYQSGAVWYGDVVEWYAGWWRHLPKHNVHVVVYEDVVADPETQVKSLAKFLGRDLSEKKLAAIVEQTSFTSMKDNKNTNIKNAQFSREFEFVRKGGIGGWKDYFTVAQSAWFDDHVADKMDGLDLTWQYE